MPDEAFELPEEAPKDAEAAEIPDETETVDGDDDKQSEEIPDDNQQSEEIPDNSDASGEIPDDNEASNAEEIPSPESGSTEEKPLPDDGIKTSKFHYLIPASGENHPLCMNVLSSAVNRFPVPILLGYNGTGEFDAKATHLAKLRSITRYLETLDPADDDDLVLIVDGYDIIQQLPPDILIERYFGLVDKYNRRTAQRFAITLDEVHKRGLVTTIFFGPDKVCWPYDYSKARCWAVPESTLPQNAYGPHQGNGDMHFNDPRWLNSGTAMGPAGHMRTLMRAVLEEIDATFDEKYEFRTSDQFYLGNLYGRQEYYRSLALGKVRVPKGRNVEIPEKRTEDQVTELHIGIEFESVLFQPLAANEKYMGWRTFRHAGLMAEMDRDMFDQGSKFKPFYIQMPPNVLQSLSKLYDAIPEAHPGKTAAEWIRQTPFSVSFITRYIHPVWHCTGPKTGIPAEFKKFWFYPLAKSLLKAAVKAVQGDVLHSDLIIDGRRWAPVRTYPDNLQEIDPLGGTWTDHAASEFINWDQLCGRHAKVLFEGEKAIEE